MKLRRSLFLSIAIVLAAGCERGPSEAQRLAEERAALERDKAQLAADKAAADREAFKAERARLADERAALGEDNVKLSAQAKAERDARAAAERRAKEEGAARKEAEERARGAAQSAAVQARAEQSVEFFYAALDPFGDWIRVERYGYCWHPQQARDPRWRPYTDGGWVFTDYGWTWRANEPFGWATYHYGRWTRLPRLGWVWVPGTEWGPAWVSWRRSDDYVGWAPLPPDAWSSSGFTAAVDSYYDIGPGLYTFVPIADFGEQTYVGHVVAPEKNVTIVNETTNVTNVTYKTVQNNVSVVNNGPDLTVVNERSRVPVQRLVVERVTSNAGGALPAKVEGNTLQIIAPFFQDGAPAAAPKRIREEVKEAKEDRGWEDAKDEEPKIREQAAKRARQAEEAERTDAATGASERRRVHAVEQSSAPAERPNPPVATPAPRISADSNEPLIPRNATPIPPRTPSARSVPSDVSATPDRERREKKPKTAEPRETQKRKDAAPVPADPAAEKTPVASPAPGGAGSGAQDPAPKSEARELQKNNEPAPTSPPAPAPQ